MLLDQADGAELTDQIADRRSVEAGRCGEGGSGQWTFEVESLQHNPEVVTPQLVGCHTASSSTALREDPAPAQLIPPPSPA
jgi:hypothetical protein